MTVALLQMRFLPDPILRTQAKKISKIPSTLPKFTDDMVETMIYEHGVGLAANQVGSLQKVCVIQLPEWEEAIVLINPEITEAEGEVELEEGCLSLPGYRGITLRSEKVKVKALGLDGKAVRIQTEGLFSQALQHEIDHLNGILYIDRLVSKDEFYKIQFDDEGNAEYVQINKDSELS